MLARQGARFFALFLLLTTARAQTSPIWIDVPFVHQPREGCGAASIAMVMNYWVAQEGARTSAVDVDSIQRQLYSPREHGITTEEMQKYLREHGFQVFALSGAWADLQEQLRKGRPLIVALKPRGQRELHYVVIDGIDPARGMITMNDPAERKLLTRERAEFEQEWGATHNWMLLAVPAQKSQ